MNTKTGYPHIDRPWMKYYEDLHISEKDPEDNIVEVLKQRNKYRMSKIAYSYYGHDVTYGEMFANADKASKALTHLGVEKEDIILFMVPNIPEEEEIWFGAIQIGAISDYIDPRPDSLDILSNANKILEIIKVEKPKYLVAIAPCYLGMLKPIEKELKELGINDIVLLDPADSMDEKAMYSYMIDVLNYDNLKQGKELVDNIPVESLMSAEPVKQKMAASMKEQEILEQACKTSPLNIYRYKELVDQSADCTFEVIRDPELVGYIGHTSGTSGARPKPIPLTNRNMISSVIQCNMAGASINEGETSLHLLPGFAPFGRFNNDILNFYNRGINIKVPEFVFGEFGYLLWKYKPNCIVTPPAFLPILQKCSYLSEENMAYLTRVIYGGAGLKPKEEKSFKDWLKIHGSYADLEKGHGMSEYAGCGSYAMDDYNKQGCIGIPLPKTIYTIVDPHIEDRLVPLKFKDDMQILEGELVVSSDHVTPGILHDEVIVPHYMMDGKEYMRTKDLGYMDRDGVFYILDRKDRAFARLDGTKIKPHVTEDIIRSNENVSDVRVVPYFDESIHGIMPKCVLIVKEPALSDDKKLEVVKDIVFRTMIDEAKISSRQIPTKFVFKNAFPLNAGSKINDKAMSNEEFDGSEITVKIDETNVSLGTIEVLRV